MNENQTVKFVAGSFFHKEIVIGSKGHFRVWGIIPVDTLGRRKTHLKGEEYAFNTRKEAIQYIDSM